MRAWADSSDEEREARRKRKPGGKDAVSQRAGKRSSTKEKSVASKLDTDLDQYFGKEKAAAPAAPSPPPASPPPASPSPEEHEDRMVAAMLLRTARSKAEQAEETGLTAYLEDARLDRRVNQRLLKGEVSQARSFNRRAGVEPLPAVAENSKPMTLVQREASALEQEFVRSAHQMREGGAAVAEVALAAGAAPQPRKRQRIGAGGHSLDVAAAEEEEARLADEDAAMANPLLRPPPGAANSKAAKRPSAPAAGTPGLSAAKEREELECGLWPSKGMRVRVLDETGEFKSSHLKKGVVQRRHSAKSAVDLELDDSKRCLKFVPQTLLETVVSRSCTRIEVIRGCHRGAIAELVSRDSRQNIAMIRLGRAMDQEEVELPLDDVCEFV